MISKILFWREMKVSIKFLLIFGAVITLYVVCIIRLYDPEAMKMLDDFTKVMPEIMAAVGMSAGATTLLGFMISYLYGFILLVFPMVFSILRSNELITKYVDNGSMVYLTAAPVKRSTIVCTQMSVLISGIFLLIFYTTVLEIFVAQILFPGELALPELCILNIGLLLLHCFIGGICFLASCIFSEMKYSVVFGAGIPVLMYVFQMIANVGQDAEKIKYFTVFTLFDPNDLIQYKQNALISLILLAAGAIILYFISKVVFCNKDLHI